MPEPWHSYPAGHVQVFRILYDLTNAGSNIALAQQIFAALYLVSLTLTCAIYHRAGGVPNWIVFLLPLSKRLHSIFVLRLFNDCWAVVTVQAAILSYQIGWDDLGTVLFRCVPLGPYTYVANDILPAPLSLSRCQYFCTSRGFLLYFSNVAALWAPSDTSSQLPSLKHSSLYLFYWTTGDHI